MSKDEILKIIREHPNITQTELMKTIGKSHFHSAQLYALVRDKIVERTIPPDTRRTWILNEVKI